MFSVNCGEIAVCGTCAYAQDGSGEYLADTQDGPVPLSLIPFGYMMTNGGTHRDNCTEADREVGCDCADLGLSWQTCDACGDLAGDRTRYTLWRLSRTEAVTRFRHAVKLARKATIIGEATRALDYAADCRRYVARLAKEDRDFAASMARRSVAA